jgi:hypothetical protein
MSSQQTRFDYGSPRRFDSPLMSAPPACSRPSSPASFGSVIIGLLTAVRVVRGGRVARWALVPPRLRLLDPFVPARRRVPRPRCAPPRARCLLVLLRRCLARVPPPERARRLLLRADFGITHLLQQDRADRRAQMPKSLSLVALDTAAECDFVSEPTGFSMAGPPCRRLPTLIIWI